MLGDRVSYKAKPCYGAGVVVGRQVLFGQVYTEVFFEKTKEKVTLLEDELIPILAPEEKMKQVMFSPARLFILRLVKDQIKHFSVLQRMQTAGNFKIIPLPHQLLAVNFILDQFKPRALIADEVGLGKTIEAALVYEELKAREIVKKVLIVVPSGLCTQWMEEMKQKFFEEFVIYDRDTVLSLKKLRGEETNVWTLVDKIITSLDYLKPQKVTGEIDQRVRQNRIWHNKHVFEAAVQAGFDVVIIDEAHKLTKDRTGEETARYKLGRALAETAPVFLLLTATPHQGESAKFKNLLSLIDSELFYQQSDITPENVRKVTVRSNKRAAVDFQGRRIFKQRLTALCLISRDEIKDQPELALYKAVSRYVSQFYDLASQQHDRTMMFLLLIYQRMVSSSSRAIWKSLKARLELLMAARKQIQGAEHIGVYHDETAPDYTEDLSAEEQLKIMENYVNMRGYLKRQDLIEIEIKELQNCVSLAHQAIVGRNDAKFTKLLEIVDEFKIKENNPGLKFVVFTEFIETQNYLNDCLARLGYKTALINGRMSAAEKNEQRKHFQKEAQFLISTDAGGEGINLQFCWVMINYDLPWNPMRLEQRIGRIDRIGQEHDVKIVNFQLANTIEQRVREVIESKLENIAREFNDGEDKLADILSTLQEEFSFERIYIDAVRRRMDEAATLEEIAQQIYERAKKIIIEGELLIPFSDLDQKYKVSERDMEKQSEKVKKLLEKYLEANGGRLIPYKNKPEAYYFEDPQSGKLMHNIIFSQRHALTYEDYEFFSLSHPYIVDLLNYLDSEQEDVSTARLLVREPKFHSQKGFLFIYRLRVTNNYDLAVDELLACFVGVDGKLNNRISQYFRECDQLDCSDLIGEPPCPFGQVEKEAYRAIVQMAEGAFFDYKTRIEEKVKEMEQRLHKYHQDQLTSINRIAVANIRESKLRELEEKNQEKQREQKRVRDLVPSLICQQIAYVEFCQ